MSSSQEEKMPFQDTPTKPTRIIPGDLSRQKWTCPSLFYSTLTILCLGILLLSTRLITLTHPTSNISLSPDLMGMTADEATPCGDNPNSARDRGCNFDPLTLAWLPPRCYNYNLTAEFLQLSDWAWYRQREDGSLRELSLTNVMQGNDMELYVTWEYHRQHCTYLWLKLHQAMMVGDPIDGVTMRHIATDVCDGVLRDKREKGDVSVAAYVTFPSCKVY